MSDDQTVETSEAGELSTDGSPDFGKYLSKGYEAGHELGEEGGGAIGAGLAEHLGVGEDMGAAIGEQLAGPVLGTAGAVLAAGAYAEAEIEHLGQEAFDAATEAGGTDPQGGTSLPGGVEPPTAEPDAGAPTDLGEVDAPGFVDGGAAADLGEVDAPGFVGDGGASAAVDFAIPVDADVDGEGSLGQDTGRPDQVGGGEVPDDGLGGGLGQDTIGPGDNEVLEPTADGAGDTVYAPVDDGAGDTVDAPVDAPVDVLDDAVFEGADGQ